MDIPAKKHEATSITLIECPRDAMQGWKNFIPTPKKIEYINSLLKVGFDTIDFGSFVSAKAIPQMEDTADVIKGLDLSNTKSKLLAIVANERGAEDAVMYDEITYLGYPFSISETFQKRNTNSTIAQSLERVESIQDLCLKNNKELVIYISMGFGNPYGDVYNEDIVLQWVEKMVDMQIGIVSIADTVGLATSTQVYDILSKITPAFSDTQIGVHLHSSVANWKEKIEAAVKAGCRRFDGALKGIGGCPMADDELVGNMDTELMVAYFNEKSLLNNLDMNALKESSNLASQIFV
ncbi:MAG: hydroxymethylglutaryl-CoA lyase [Bacteroidota bacterium]